MAIPRRHSIAAGQEIVLESLRSHDGGRKFHRIDCQKKAAITRDSFHHWTCGNSQEPEIRVLNAFFASMNGFSMDSPTSRFNLFLLALCSRFSRISWMFVERGLSTKCLETMSTSLSHTLSCLYP